MFCVDLIEQRGADPLWTILDQLGGWPVVKDTWKEEDFDWIKLMAEMCLYNRRVLINIWVSSDDKDSDSNVIYVSI